MDVVPAALSGHVGIRSSGISSGSGIRIGDAERERAAQALGEHLRAGRLEVGEYDERLTAAFGARTASELTPLFADLPGGSPVAPPMPEPRSRNRNGRARPTTRVRRSHGARCAFALVLALIAGAVIWTAFMAFPPLFLIPLLWFGFGRRRGHRHHGYAGPGPRRYRY